MNDFVCKECGKEFENRKSFHLHLKAHAVTIGDYYVKHFKKKDLYSGSLLPFKTYDQYFNEDFSCFENYLDWLSIAPEKKCKEYLLAKTKDKFDHKKIKIAPPNLFYQLSEMPDIRTYRRLWGSYSSFSNELGIKNQFNKNLPEDFWTKDCQDIKIFVDTREKLPFSFYNSFTNKLDFGDYTAGGEHYSKTFVDRKSQDDFRQTFGKDIERFKREMDRCVRFNSYMFVVIESCIDQIEEDNKVSKFKSNLGYVWHNLRGLMVDYPENIQFIFAHSRSGAKKLIPKILYYGKELWNVDLQYHIETKVYKNSDRIISLSK
jgi:hypothetical protein